MIRAWIRWGLNRSRQLHETHLLSDAPARQFGRPSSWPELKLYAGGPASALDMSSSQSESPWADATVAGAMILSDSHGLYLLAGLARKDCYPKEGPLCCTVSLQESKYPVLWSAC